VNACEQYNHVGTTRNKFWWESGGDGNRGNKRCPVNSAELENAIKHVGSFFQKLYFLLCVINVFLVYLDLNVTNNTLA